MPLEVQLAQMPEAWELNDVDDLFEAAPELAARGFRGQVSWALPTPTAESVVWQLKVNRENDPDGVQAEVVAHVGDRLLLANGILQRLTAEQLAAAIAS